MEENSSGVRVINAFDERLPKFTSRLAEDHFVRSIMEFQIDPILINVRDGSWRVVAGNRRLSAIRQARELGGNGMIKATFVYDMSDEWERKILIVENAMRSENKPAQYHALKELLKIYGNYKAVAEILHLTVPVVKKMDNDWAGVPPWAEKACLAGDISLSVTIDIGKASDKIKERAKKTFELEGSVTSADLKLFSAVQKAEVSEATEDAFAGYEFASPAKTKSFVSAADVQVVIDSIKSAAIAGIPAHDILMQTVEQLEALLK